VSFESSVATRGIIGRVFRPCRRRNRPARSRRRRRRRSSATGAASRHRPRTAPGGGTASWRVRPLDGPALFADAVNSRPWPDCTADVAAWPAPPAGWAGMVSLVDCPCVTVAGVTAFSPPGHIGEIGDDLVEVMLYGAGAGLKAVHHKLVQNRRSGCARRLRRWHRACAVQPAAAVAPPPA
jgi:hypothetical protein